MKSSVLVHVFGGNVCCHLIYKAGEETYDKPVLVIYVAMTSGDEEKAVVGIIFAAGLVIPAAIRPSGRSGNSINKKPVFHCSKGKKKGRK